MKKCLVFVVVLVLLSFTGSVFAESTYPFKSHVPYEKQRSANDSAGYIGIGVSYIPKIADTELDAAFVPYLEVGYKFNSTISLGFEFSIASFEGTESTPYDRYHRSGEFVFDSNVDINMYMVMGKISPNFGSRVVKPYVTVGLGLIEVDYEGELSYSCSSGSISLLTSSGSVSDPGIKVGAGVDFFTCDSVSVGVEVTYIQGLEDLEDFDCVGYTFGLNLYFN